MRIDPEHIEAIAQAVKQQSDQLGRMVDNFAREVPKVFQRANEEMKRASEALERFSSRR